MNQQTKELTKAIKTSDESIIDHLLEKNASLSLESASFKGENIGAMRIHDVNCANTEWEACLFDGTVFDGIDLQGAYFNGCTFHQCSFKNAILAETSFEGCVLKGTSIADTEDCEALEITNCQFQECEFVNVHLLDATLESVTITNGKISGFDGPAELKSVVLRNVEVSEFDTSEMTLTACTASQCAKLPAGFKAVEGKRRRV